jgi:hypothetical protein
MNFPEWRRDQANLKMDVDDSFCLAQSLGMELGDNVKLCLRNIEAVDWTNVM